MGKAPVNSGCVATGVIIEPRLRRTAGTVVRRLLSPSALALKGFWNSWSLSWRDCVCCALIATPLVDATDIGVCWINLQLVKLMSWLEPKCWRKGWTCRASRWPLCWPLMACCIVPISGLGSRRFSCCCNWQAGLAVGSVPGKCLFRPIALIIQ